MKRANFVAMALGGLAACSSGPSTPASTTPLTENGWTSAKQVDDFTDQRSCKITFATKFLSYSSRKVFSIYPVVIVNADGSVEVGAETVPMQTNLKISIPMGDIQLRIDDKPFHDLKAIDQAAFQAQIASGNQAAATAAMSKGIMSPITVATGTQASSILDEMLTGKTLRVRQTSPAIEGDTGTFPLNGFATELAKCKS